MRRHRIIGALAAFVMAITAVPARAAPATFNVEDYGAKGNGTTVDSPAIDKAIAAASAAPGGIVDFPAGTYLARTIQLKSNVTINLRAGSKIIAVGSGMDSAEPNPFSRYQDFGHSHFRNALLWGEHVENVSSRSPAPAPSTATTSSPPATTCRTASRTSCCR